VTTDETSALTDGAASSSKCASSDKIEADSSKWENLRPTLRSLGLVRETLNVSSSNLNASTEEDSDFDSLSDDDGDDDDDESDIDDDVEEEEDTHDDDNENDFDLESIQKRRKKYRQKLKLRKKKKLRLLQERDDALKSKKPDGDELQCITVDSEPIIIEEVPKIIQRVDSTTTEDTKQDLKSISNKLNNQNGKPRTSVSLSKSVEPSGSDLDKKSGKCIFKVFLLKNFSHFFLNSKLQF